MTEAPRQPRSFRSNVPYYARYRPGYPDALIARVSAFVGLAPGDMVMDLGCGPGTLAIPFARAGMAVTAIDPEPGMREGCRAAAHEAGLAVDVRAGSSFDLGGVAGPFKLVVMGRAFHWMDRAATLAALGPLVARDGAVALFSNTHPVTTENTWRLRQREVMRAYGCESSPHRGEGAGVDYRSHESMLFDSEFSQLAGLSEFVRCEIGADDIVGRTFSQTISSPEKLGARAAAFEAELRAALHALSPGGRFIEISEILALVARRPKGTPMP